MVKDSTDLGGTSFFLDTDGRISDNQARPQNSFRSVNDGQWHMVTLTTQPAGTHG